MTILPPIVECPHCGVPVRTHLIETEAAPPIEVVVEPKPKPVAILRGREDPESPEVYELALFWALHYPVCRKMQMQGIGRKAFEAFRGMMAQKLGSCVGTPITRDFDERVEDPDGLPLPPFQKIAKAPASK